LSLPNTTGMLQLMSDVVSLPTWLTYQQIAERLGLRSASAAAARARRAKWPRRIKNDTLEAEVCVPADLVAAGPQKIAATRAVLRSGLVSSIVTDAEIAAAVLA